MNFFMQDLQLTLVRLKKKLVGGQCDDTANQVKQNTAKIIGLTCSKHTNLVQAHSPLITCVYDTKTHET